MIPTTKVLLEMMVFFSPVFGHVFLGGHEPKREPGQQQMRVQDNLPPPFDSGVFFHHGNLRYPPKATPPSNKGLIRPY